MRLRESSILKLLKTIFVRLLKVKLEYNRHSFRFAGAKIYNELPVRIRGEKDPKRFRELLVKIFY